MNEPPLPGPVWPLDWRALERDEQAAWWEQLWVAAVKLNERYALGLRSGWWLDEIQVETLAAFASWVNAYDTGAWNDPAGKLQLLHDLDRIRGLLRAGDGVFDPERDQARFDQRAGAHR